MDLGVLARAVSIGIIMLVCVLQGYLKLYEQKINQAVEQGRPMKKPMVPPFKVANALKVVLALAVFLPLISDAAASINRDRNLERSVEQQAAEKQMSVAFAATKDNAAALYYKEDGSDHTFALYETRGTIFKEYVFLHGGSATSIDEGVRAFRMEKSGELVLFSMNRLRIAKIVCHDGEAYHLDPDSPFVLILPSGGADIYDKNGALIDLEQNEWYVVTTKE